MRIRPHARPHGHPTLRLALLLLCTCCAWTTTVRAAPSVTEVARQLVCDCPDCGNKALDQCPDCTKGKEYRAEIAALLGKGESQQQIINHFADKYGEHLLGTPRPRGFGRLAVLMPFAIVAAGTLPVLLALRVRRRRSGTAATTTNTPPTADTVSTERLDAALRDYDF